MATAAGLLVTLDVLARRIAGQANEIAATLEQTERHTAALWGVPALNASLERLVGLLRPPVEGEAK